MTSESDGPRAGTRPGSHEPDWRPARPCTGATGRSAGVVVHHVRVRDLGACRELGVVMAAAAADAMAAASAVRIGSPAARSDPIVTVPPRRDSDAAGPGHDPHEPAQLPGRLVQVSHPGRLEVRARSL